MKNPDEAINRVLTGLRDAESPEGMNRRILDAIRAWRLGKAEAETDMAYDPPGPDRHADVDDRCRKRSRRRFADLLDRLPEPSNRTRHCDGKEAGNASKYTGS